ncbi:MAG TPA: hypothetical protein QF753_19265 [Victivallales bacterium]|nr:hypothetical protein [Victivallales bacterium]
MDKKWKCPNKPNVKNHPEVILFEESDSMKESQILTHMITHCSYCRKSYTRKDCIEV